MCHDDQALVNGVVPLTVVVAAVIRNRAGELLLARRPAGVHMAGLWELPGGKLHEGESPVAALARELQEELGVTAVAEAPITFAVHEEPDRRILLLFYATRLISGEPRPLEGQELAWVPPDHLRDYPTPPADAEILAQLSSAQFSSESR